MYAHVTVHQPYMPASLYRRKHMPSRPTSEATTDQNSSARNRVPHGSKWLLLHHQVEGLSAALSPELMCVNKYVGLTRSTVSE